MWTLGVACCERALSCGRHQSTEHIGCISRVSAVELADLALRSALLSAFGVTMRRAPLLERSLRARCSKRRQVRQRLYPASGPTRHYPHSSCSGRKVQESLRSHYSRSLCTTLPPPALPHLSELALRCSAGGGWWLRGLNTRRLWRPCMSRRHSLRRNGTKRGVCGLCITMSSFSARAILRLPMCLKSCAYDHDFRKF